MKTNKKNAPVPRSKKFVGKDRQAANSLSKYKPGKKQTGEAVTRMSILNEPTPSYSISSRMRAIGNSKGVILPNRVIEEAGISPDAELIIQVSNGVILIAEAKSPGSVNTDLSTWDAQFKKAIKKGNKPGSDSWGSMQNRFDEEDWV